LVIEDVRVLADEIADGLRDRGMAVDVAYDGTDGLDKALVNGYDVVVVDRDLPGLHGDEVCRSLVGTPAPPRMLMLTAAGTVRDRVEGLSIGADDYLAKPFAFAELVARIRALFRRPSTAVPPVLTRAGITLDAGRRSVVREGCAVALSRKEFAVLELLLAADGRVVSAEELLERAWDEHADPFTSAVRVAMANLRRKLGDPPVIETLVGAGYRIR
jgi:DNA-binding response OmpR family regulator